MFEWSPDLSVKEQSMDSQHQGLLVLMAKFSATPPSESQKAAQILKELLVKTRDHFQAEEQMLSRTKYPSLEKHKKIHRSLLTKLSEFQTQLHQAPSEELKRHIVIFLEAWLIGHIKEIDQNYGPFLKTS